MLPNLITKEILKKSHTKQFGSHLVRDSNLYATKLSKINLDFWSVLQENGQLQIWATLQNSLESSIQDLTDISLDLTSSFLLQFIISVQSNKNLPFKKEKSQGCYTLEKSPTHPRTFS